jgi:FkbH-like protein
MYNIVWENTFLYSLEEPVKSEFKSRLSIKDISAAALLYWNEHCLECAPPDCYNQCPIFICRVDKKCVRMKYGFVQNSNFSGLYPYGIDCRFEKWGKIETFYSSRAFSPINIRKIGVLNDIILRTILKISLLFRWLSPTLKLTGFFIFIESILIYKQTNKELFDAFVFECYSVQKDVFRIRLQIYENDKIIFIYSFIINQGHNFFELPFRYFHLPKNKKMRIFLTPENNELKPRLIITWLDFIKYRFPSSCAIAKENLAPALKIKCVAWDLDNTIWSGILEECGPEKIYINPFIEKILDSLDKRGILNTIVSKNSYENAWPVLESLGIAKYFVFPAINWNSKSGNLKEIASKINIGINSFAFIDDSPHERSEVEGSLPMVRVFSENDIPFLLEREEFDVPITEEATTRRLSYQSEMNRIEVLQSFGKNYDDFLYSLQMHVSLFKPSTKTHIDRCFELLQRSNQLNLTTHRYSREEFLNIINDDEHFFCQAFTCADKFGDYGIVGFISLEKKHQIAVVHDLVISCRVAQKKVEQTVFSAIASMLQKINECKSLSLTMIKTKRNGPLAVVLQSLPFSIIEESQDNINYYLNDLSQFADIRTPCCVD